MKCLPGDACRGTSKGRVTLPGLKVVLCVLDERSTRFYVSILHHYRRPSVTGFLSFIASCRVIGIMGKSTVMAGCIREVVDVQRKNNGPRYSSSRNYNFQMESGGKYLINGNTGISARKQVCNSDIITYVQYRCSVHHILNYAVQP